MTMPMHEPQHAEKATRLYVEGGTRTVKVEMTDAEAEKEVKAARKSQRFAKFPALTHSFFTTGDMVRIDPARITGMRSVNLPTAEEIEQAEAAYKRMIESAQVVEGEGDSFAAAGAAALLVMGDTQYDTQ
jgi:hypothetical protein